MPHYVWLHRRAMMTAAQITGSDSGVPTVTSGRLIAFGDTVYRVYTDGRVNRI